MNERIIKLGLESGMLNYVDLETPRHYFLCGHADEECLNKFAELIVRECSKIADDWVDDKNNGKNYPSEIIKQHFGVER